MKAFCKRFYLWLPVLVLPFALLGCGDSTGTNNKDKGKDKVYEIKGKVTAVEAEKKKVTLDHEDIPGFMNAMTMPFDVENERLLQGITPGDQVHGKLQVKSGGDYVLTELHKE
jgi:protein SCO1/2